MDKVEKFEKNLQKLLENCKEYYELPNNTKSRTYDSKLKRIVKGKQELIKMYSDEVNKNEKI